MIDNVAKFYKKIEKNTNKYLESVIDKHLIVAKLEFEGKYKREPKENELIEIKKNIVLRYFFPRLALLLLFLLIVIATFH